MEDPVAQEYRRRAAEVDKLAETAMSEGHRRELLQIAAQWRKMAAEHEEFWSRKTRPT